MDVPRRVPVDLIGLGVIALAVCGSHLPLVLHGMQFNDPSWYFHFGRRALAGDVPYRDYVFQVGPLPIYVDAGFQEVFGSTYVASLYACVFVKFLRVWAVWMIARRVANVRVASLFALWCIADPLFSIPWHWSTSYSQLFITLGGLFLLLASRTSGRRALWNLGLAGFFAALVVSTRQSCAIVVAFVLVAVPVSLFLRRDAFDRAKLAALWSGLGAAFVVVFGLLAVIGALRPAVQQMFLDAPQKKSVSGLEALFDAVSGGALVDPGFHWWTGFLYFLAVPIAAVAAIVWLARRERTTSIGTTALAILPGLVLLAMLERDASFAVFSDLPRTLFSVLVAVCALSPDRLRRWFGLEPLVVIGLAALPLASDWALEMSLPGRGWGDASSLTVAVIVVALASSRLSLRAKELVCGALAVLGVVGALMTAKANMDPLGTGDPPYGAAYEGPVAFDDGVLRRLRVPTWRRQILQWLASEVKPGMTCFIYSNYPVLYDLLHCKNPTRLDTIAADFITAEDANTAVAALRAAPPDFIIASDRQWMSPPLSLDLGAQLDRYGGLNPRASMAMHVGVRSLLDQYEVVGHVPDALGADVAQQAAAGRDYLDSVWLYRRKR